MAKEFDTFVFKLPLALVFLFFLILYRVLISNPSVFMKRHGRKHAITGFVYLVWISYGFVDLFRTKAAISNDTPNDLLQQNSSAYSYFLYDVVLGILGTVLTLYAAFEFKHKNVVNVASGTLDEHATVTYGEMIEHSFYQVLNLIQIIFLHGMVIITQQFREDIPNNKKSTFYLSIHFFMLAFVTILWNLRHLFPINKFSDNYNKNDEKSTNFIRLLYRIKKYQYVFYKHFLLHGLNLSVVYCYHQMVHGEVSRVASDNILSFLNSKYFHMYWLCLNFSYVMEFFLQTLVKKSYLKQQTMLLLQQILMLASTIVAVHLLRYVSVPLSLLSLVLNFTYRKHDFLNTFLIFAVWLGNYHFPLICGTITTRFLL